jgi:hypothetical protein
MSDILCMSQIMYMYICVGCIDFASVSKIFQFEFRNVPTVSYCFVFDFITKFHSIEIIIMV